MTLQSIVVPELLRSGQYDVSTLEIAREARPVLGRADGQYAGGRRPPRCLSGGQRSSTSRPTGGARTGWPTAERMTARTGTTG
jgi:hypothetical protein